MKAVITRFSLQYWNIWGVSWLASLRSLGSYDGPIIIYQTGFPNSLKVYLEKFNVKCLPLKNLFQDIADLPKGLYVYWDGDIYFQDDVNPIFDLCKEKPVVSRNYSIDKTLRSNSIINSGFIAADSSDWRYIANLETLHQDFGIKNPLLDCLTDCLVDDIWNCTYFGNLCLKDCFYLNDKKVKAIHPSNSLKNMPDIKLYLFPHIYPKIYNKWVAKFKNNLEMPRKVYFR